MQEIMDRIKKCLQQIESELEGYKDLEKDIENLRMIQKRIDEDYRVYEQESHRRYKMVYDIINKNK